MLGQFLGLSFGGHGDPPAVTDLSQTYHDQKNRGQTWQVIIKHPIPDNNIGAEHNSFGGIAKRGG
jgi:hypothetical protein